MNDSKMNATEAVEALSALGLLGSGDPESDHHRADLILLATVPESVRKAYAELVERSDWWAHA